MLRLLWLCEWLKIAHYGNYFSPCLAKWEKSNHKYVGLFYTVDWGDGWYSTLRPSHNLPKPHTQAFIKCKTKTLKHLLAFGFFVCLFSFVFLISVLYTGSPVTNNIIFCLLDKRKWYLNFQIILKEKRFSYSYCTWLFQCPKPERCTCKDLCDAILSCSQLTASVKPCP